MKNSVLNPSQPSLLRHFRSASPLVGLTLLTLSLVACGSGSTSTPLPTNASSVSAPVGTASGSNPDLALVPYVYDGSDHSWSEAANSLRPQAIAIGSNDLSAQNWSSATSGWGPVERNKSNGESGANDGNPITLNGKVYATGLGVHAPSQLVYTLGGQCTTFQSDIGLDDEVKSLGSVTFEVWADGTKLYDSGKMIGGQASKNVSVSVAGKTELKLIVTDGGDNINYDHADWAGATLSGCTGSTTGSWTTVASEFKSFTLTASSTVRYGIGTQWVQKVLAPGSYLCGNDLFGDPAFGIAKQCDVSSAVRTNQIAAPTPYSGPLVITKGGTYSGNWESQDPNVPVINIQTSDPVIIENSNVRGKGTLVTGWFNRVTLRNNSFVGLNPNVYDKQGSQAFILASPYAVDAENNTIDNTQGIYINSYSGDASKGETFKILRNKFKNVNGLHSDGNGGYDLTRPDSFAHAVQFVNVHRIAGAEIAWNEIINEPGKSQVEENINMYVSGGTTASPLLIHDNYVQGAFNSQPGIKSVYAGGGILVGDGYSSNPTDSGYTKVYNNQVVGTTNEGMAISGGVENHVYNNRVISSGLLPDGSRNMAQNVGIYMWDINNAGNNAVPTFLNNTMENNYVAWTRVNAEGSKWTNPWWMATCNVHNSTCANNVSGGVATPDTEKQEYQLWLSKLSSNGVSLGKSN